MGLESTITSVILAPILISEQSSYCLNTHLRIVSNHHFHMYLEGRSADVSPMLDGIIMTTDAVDLELFSIARSC